MRTERYHVILFSHLHPSLLVGPGKTSQQRNCPSYPDPASSSSSFSSSSDNLELNAKLYAELKERILRLSSSPSPDNNNNNDNNDSSSDEDSLMSQLFTIIIRDFEEWDHRIPVVLQRIRQRWPSVEVCGVCMYVCVCVY